jgi:hypothetical protein
MRYCIVAVGCLLLSTASLSAQRSVDPRLYVGAQVRVRAVDVQQTGAPRAETISGKLVAQRGESLYVESQPGVAPRPVALSSVRGLWVSQGQTRRRTLRGTMIGALAGGALSVAMAVVSGDPCDDSTFDCITPIPHPGIYFGVGAAVGGVIGGTIGYFRRSEWWERIR